MIQAWSNARKVIGKELKEEAMDQVEFQRDAAHEGEKTIADPELHSRQKHEAHEGAGCKHLRKQSDPATKYFVGSVPILTVIGEAVLRIEGNAVCDEHSGKK